MKKFSLYLVFLPILLLSCEIKNEQVNSPYKVFLNKARLPELTDTVLLASDKVIIDSKTRGDLYAEAYERTKKDDFLSLYGYAFEQDKLSEYFEQRFKTKILRVNDFDTKKQARLRLFKEKYSIYFKTEVIDYDTVMMFMLIHNPLQKMQIIKHGKLIKKEQWRLQTLESRLLPETDSLPLP